MKLNLDFALYKGKTRLREWWKVVKAHFTAVQDAVNELDTAITDEAAIRERVDGVIIANVADAASAIAAETAAREAADRQFNESLTRHYQYIEDEGKARQWADEAIRKSKLSFFDFGVYNVAAKTVENSNANEQYGETLEAIGSFEAGSLIRFSVDADCTEAAIPVVLYDGYLNEKIARINITHSFIRGHTYIARVLTAPGVGSIAGPHTNYYAIDGTAEVISDNDVSVGAASGMAAEQTARTSADNALSDRLTDEETARTNADNVLRGNLVDIAAAIAAESAAREAAESEIKADITALQGASHTHGNKEIIDTITAEDVERWRELETQVTEEQLTEAIEAEATDRVKGDEENKSYIEYLEKVCFGFSAELQNIYAAMGCTVYDGGLFGAPVDGAELNGGEFGEEESGIVDCGDFEPFRCSCGGGGSTQTIDGGGYSDTSGTVIDGGSFADVNGTVIDGGEYP